MGQDNISINTKQRKLGDEDILPEKVYMKNKKIHENSETNFNYEKTFFNIITPKIHDKSKKDDLDQLILRDDSLPSTQITENSLIKNYFLQENKSNRIFPNYNDSIKITIPNGKVIYMLNRRLPSLEKDYEPRTEPKNNKVLNIEFGKKNNNYMNSINTNTNLKLDMGNENNYESRTESKKNKVLNIEFGKKNNNYINSINTNTNLKLDMENKNENNNHIIKDIEEYDLLIEKFEEKLWHSNWEKIRCRKLFKF